MWPWLKQMLKASDCLTALRIYPRTSQSHLQQGIDFNDLVQMQAAAVVQLQLQILLMDKHSTRRLRILIALYESWCYDLFSVPGVLCSFCSSCPP